MFERHSSAVQTTARYGAPPITAVRDWRAEAVAASREAESPEGSALCRALAARIADLTGRAVALEAIQRHRQGQSATVVVDGTCFRLRRRTLCVVRPCVYCGVGRFESAAIDDLAELGHAIAVWEPRCADCGVDDEDWTHSF